MSHGSRAGLVSVVIVTRNRLPFLKEAVASVGAQTYEDWELLIIDDASTDETREWLSELRDPQVRCFHQPEHGERSAARNRGLAHARGEFVMFLDDDDRLRPGALADLAGPLKQQPGAIGAVGARWRFREGGEAVRIEHPRRPLKRVIWPELLAGWSAVSGQNLYRTARVRDAGGYREEVSIVEDRDLWLRVARLGPVLLLPDIVLDYRIHDGQYRPPDIVDLRERVFREFIERLPTRERPQARRIRESARWSQDADREYARGNYGAALAGYLKACGAAPALSFSPLTGPPLTRQIRRSVRRLLPGQAARATP
jgi:glycosyltransferase involved in cell wall biosynthesis